MPAHDRQMKIPNLGDAHCGLGAPQSQQMLLLDSFCIARSYILGRKRIQLANASGIPAPHKRRTRAQELAKLCGLGESAIRTRTYL